MNHAIVSLATILLANAYSAEKTTDVVVPIKQIKITTECGPALLCIGHVYKGGTGEPRLVTCYPENGSCPEADVCSSKTIARPEDSNEANKDFHVITWGSGRGSAVRREPGDTTPGGNGPRNNDPAPHGNHPTTSNPPQASAPKVPRELPDYLQENWGKDWAFPEPDFSEQKARDASRDEYVKNRKALAESVPLGENGSTREPANVGLAVVAADAILELSLLELLKYLPALAIYHEDITKLVNELHTVLSEKIKKLEASGQKPKGKLIDAKEMLRRLGRKDKDFHEIKRKIKNQHKVDLRKLGWKNPDIHINEETGTIVFEDVQHRPIGRPFTRETRTIYDTETPFSDFLE